MAKRLFNLRDVPDDEADAVRALLDEHHIEWYETRPGPFGLTSGAIWLRESDQATRAKELLDGYQRQRVKQMRALREQALREGRAETFASLLRERPLWVLLRIVAIALLLALMGLPAYLLWQ